VKAFVTILNKGVEEGSMSFQGEPRYMAMVTASIIKGASLYGRRYGQETFDGLIAQLKLILSPPT